MTYFVETVQNEETGETVAAYGACAGNGPQRQPSYPWRRLSLECGDHLKARVVAHFRSPSPSVDDTGEWVEEDGAYHEALLRCRP